MQAPRRREELDLMRKSGKIAALAMKEVLGHVREGVTLEELDQIADKEIVKHGGMAAFKLVPGYKFATCMCVGSEIVHGTPRKIVLQKGEVISIDLGVNFEGWNTDTAWTVMVGGGEGLFLQAGEKAMWQGVRQAVSGNRIGDISQAMQDVLEQENSFYASRSLIGHGVGRQLHEEPEVPGFGNKGTGEMLREGMTLAIEAIYTESKTETAIGEDNWVVKAVNGALAGMFEMSVIVGKKRAEVLTDWRKA